MAAPRGPVKQKPKRAQKTLTQEMSVLLAKTFLPDLTARAQQPAVARALRDRWQAERDGKRTAAGLDEWVAATVEQVGAAWILSCVFVRVLEDRGFLDRRRIAGDGADDSLQQFLEIAPSLTERDYLLTVFRELATYPGAADVLDPTHNPAWRLSPSNDSVRALLALLREADADGKLRFRFTREETRDTRFLGDLYQDLSESVRKRHALLQTPDFVERFILDQTLEPAIAEFGLEAVRLIDPTCGSGHFLLGGFHRLFEHRQRAAPGLDRRDHAKAALAQVYGIDINPYAVAIARFRLTLAYSEHAGIDRLALAPRIETNLVVADSLLHGVSQGRLSEVAEDKAAWGDQMFALDDPAGAQRVLGQRYHAVVGNPPYITCKDPVLRDAYRASYESAAGKYALSAPFTERFFQLAEPGGYVGMINANSYMKREFGKALIEKVLPRIELTEVIDTSGAYIPGHGTPTVLLFGRNRSPVAANVHVVMGKRGEPTTPEDPEKGHVWSAVAGHHLEIGFENDYLSVAEVPRETISKHPWSLGGGGAAELKELLEERCEKRLGDVVEEIGFASFPGLDDLFLQPHGVLKRWGIDDYLIRPIVIGEDVRDWAMPPGSEALAPYDRSTHAPLPLEAASRWYRAVWPQRTTVKAIVSFGGKTRGELGEDWWLWYRWQPERYLAKYRIAFAEVATHNHFVLDRGGKVFKQTAPIIKLPAGATEDDHLALLAYLNSSTACFWMKQVFYPKGMHNGSEANATPFLVRYAFDGTKLASLPIPAGLLQDTRLVELGRKSDRLARERTKLLGIGELDSSQGTDQLNDRVRLLEGARNQMIGLQEEIDWRVYELFGLIPAQEGPPSDYRLRPGERPFEIILAGDREAVEKGWFRWNQIEPVREIPRNLPHVLTSSMHRRIAALTSIPELRLLERPEFKRRWLQPSGKAAQELQTELKSLQDSVDRFLADRLEEHVSGELQPLSERRLLSDAEQDDLLMAMIKWRYPDESADVVLRSIVHAQSVPFSAPQRFTDAGWHKHLDWLKVWEHQRSDDAVGRNSPITPPPRYEPTDYQGNYWQLRGKLDVPKERFISYRGLEPDGDPTPLIGWAGWNHLQRAQALAAVFQERKDQDGWPKERLIPILAGILELVPWLKQWHNEPDPAYDGQRMGDVYEAFVSEKTRALQVTLGELRAWRPASARTAQRKARTTGKVAASTATKAAAEAAVREPEEETTI